MEQTLGTRIAANRKRLGLTQEQLADRLGVTPQAVSKWENNQSCPDISILPRLAQIFEITTDELMGVKQETVHQAELVTEKPEEESKKGWAFQWDSGKKDSLFLAVWVLLTGVLLLLSNVLGWKAGFWGILWTCGLTVFGLFGIYPRFSFFRVGCALFGGASLIKELGIWKLPIGEGMIFPILLLLFGMSLLADAVKKPRSKTFHFVNHGRPGKKGTNAFEMNEDSFVCSVSFGAQSHEVTLPRLSNGNASVCFGELKVNLTGCETISPDAAVDVSCSFGELELLVPKHCIVTHGIDTHFASLEIHGAPAPDASIPLRLNGNVSFGEITIQYV